jgi:hypothetical protein
MSETPLEACLEHLKAEPPAGGEDHMRWMEELETYCVMLSPEEWSFAVMRTGEITAQ